MIDVPNENLGPLSMNHEPTRSQTKNKPEALGVQVENRTRDHKGPQTATKSWPRTASSDHGPVAKGWPREKPKV